MENKIVCQDRLTKRLTIAETIKEKIAEDKSAQYFPMGNGGSRTKETRARRRDRETQTEKTGKSLCTNKSAYIGRDEPKRSNCQKTDYHH